MPNHHHVRWFDINLKSLLIISFELNAQCMETL